ncbi:uncharacterized protein LOC120108352, partial [Phoenix dactylifera]|uniref:Uncharacterized protein LOC120108352 n=1 Tax=Phoenix dactylifera TaxID=42345 RepID=A0A8B9A3E4_PHODC
MILANNPAVMINNASLMIPPSNSPSNILLEPVPGLKHGIGLAVDWSYEELAELREGLDRYANEPNIMKYIKIAARLPDKTVRDVAMRCRWMTVSIPYVIELVAFFNLFFMIAHLYAVLISCCTCIMICY